MIVSVGVFSLPGVFVADCKVGNWDGCPKGSIYGMKEGVIPDSNEETSSYYVYQDKDTVSVASRYSRPK